MNSDNISVTEIVAEYEKFFSSTVLDCIKSRNRLGASRYEIMLMVTPIVNKKFSGVGFSEKSLVKALGDLLERDLIYLSYHRYIVKL